MVGGRIVTAMGSIEVLWTSNELISAEHFVLEHLHSGARLAGTTVIVFEDHPAHLTYEVLVDDAWRTRSAAVELLGHRAVAIDVSVDGDAWFVDAIRRPDLDGCVDIDLGWTPATNVLPIRRLGVEVGDAVEITTAWVQFPEMTVVPNHQRYERTGQTSWRYSSGPYDFSIDTTADGIVTRYGDDLWSARAVRRA